MPYYDNFKSLRERQNLGSKVDSYLKSVGLDEFSKQRRQYQQSADQLGNYLSGGQYTSADNQSYRDQATKAIADLDEQLKSYTKSSDEYKTLDSYRSYYQTALNDFDRMDVVMSTGDYVGADAWHSSDDYTAQKTALQSSIDQLGAEMDAMEDKTSADYQRLKGYYDWYNEAMAGLDERNKWDSQFESADDYVLFQNSQDYKNTVQLQQQIAQAQARLDEITPTLQLQSAGGDLNNVDMELYAESIKLQQSIAEWQKDLDKMEQWQGSIALSHFGDFDPNTDYQALVDELKTAKQAAKTDEERAQIDMQLRVLAGANYDGTNGNGLFDKSSYLGRQQMLGFNTEDAQKRIDEIDKELTSLGVPTERWVAMIDQDQAAMSAGSGAEAPEPQLTAEEQKHVEELRREKRELTQKISSAQALQAADEMSSAFHELPADRAEKLKEEALKHVDGEKYQQKDYDPTKSSGVADLKNFEYLLGDDEDTARILEQLQVDPQLADMVYAAIGAEWLGEDIGFTVQDLLDAYGADMAQVAGYKQAKKISDIESDFARWNRQVFGVGTAAGLNQFWTGMRQFFSDDYIAPNATAARAAYTRADLSRYGDEQILSGSSQGGSNISQLMFDTVQTTANMLPMIAASYLTKGALAGVGVAATAAATAGQIAGAAIMGVSSAGNSYQQALAEGWNKEDARVFSLITGAAEGGLQYLLGGISGLGGVTEEGILAAARGMNNAAVRIATETGVHIVSETTEELLQNRIERYLRYTLMDEGSANWMAWDDDDWYTVLITALSTGAMEGPGTVINVARDTEIGKIASGQKPGIPSKGLATQYKQQRTIASAVGGYVKSDEALQYTLLALSEQMGADSESHKLAEKIQKRGGQANDLQLGTLFSTYLSENGNADAVMAALVGGGVKYHEIQRLNAEANAAKENYEAMKSANPGAEVLDKTATELKNLGVRPAAAMETAPIINKVLSGTSLSSSEMEAITGDSMAARAARVLLSQRNPVLKVTMNTSEAEGAINSLVEDMRELGRQQKALEKDQVVQAAMDAVAQAEVSKATRNANLHPEDLQERVDAATAEDLQKANSKVEMAEQQLAAIQNMSFQELGAMELSGVAKALGLSAAEAATVTELQDRVKALNERAKALSEVKVPSKAQRTELLEIRQEQNEIKAQLMQLGQNAAQQVSVSETSAAAPSEAAPNTSGRVIVLPNGSQVTQESFVQNRLGAARKSNPSITAEELQAVEAKANKDFNEQAALAGTEKGTSENGQQRTDHDQERNGLGKRGDRSEDRQRGDRPEQGADGQRDAGVDELRTQSGQHAADVSKDAVLTDSGSTQLLEKDFPDIRKLSEDLKKSGFKKVTYVTKGRILNSAGQSVPAVYRDGELFLRLDYRTAGYDYRKTAEHERTHLRMDLFRKRFGAAEANAFVTAALQNVLGKEAYEAAFAKYARAYAPIYLQAVGSITEVGYMINEEMLCDMTGGINEHDTELGDFQSETTEFLNDSRFDAVTGQLADPDFNGDPGTVMTEETGQMPYDLTAEELIPKDLTDPFRNDDAPDVPDEVKPYPGEEQGHSDGVSMLSMTSMAEATGFRLVENDTGLPYALLDANGNRVTHVTADMMRGTPLGRLVQDAAAVNPETGRAFISKAAAEKEYQLLADAMNLIVQYNDAAVVWELVGSQLFSGIKKNSDTQYNLTIDFGTICRKTQQLVDVMSKTMVKLGRGLSRREVEVLYQETGKAGEATPCPVCYVFSRWMGIGGLLDQINTFQNEYAGGKYTQEQLADFMTEIERGAEQYAREKGKADFYDENGSLKLGKVLSDMKTKYNNQAASAIKKLNQHQQAVSAIADLQELSKTATAEKAAEYQKAIKGLQRFVLKDAKIAEAEAQLREAEESLAPFEAYQWMAKTLMKQDTSTVDENGNPVEKWVINPEYKAVPKDVLFDLNHGADFAKDYPLTWAFRTGKGCAMGKAINPYSDARVGETIQGVASGDVKNIKVGADINAFLNGDEKERARIMTSALKKMRQQNLIGGMRFQSTSDFRFEWGSDYLMTFFELQALGANVQLYTKVLEAVDFLASTNADCNLSVMPLSDGIATDENGVAKLVYSGITGVDADEAIKKAHQYDNVQLILVGISDEHIKLALAGTDVTFVIPFHGSGQSVHQVQTLMDLIGEGLDVTKAQDYSNVQTDHVSKTQTPEQKAMWDLRMAIIMGNAENLSAQQQMLLQKNPHLQKLYDMFYNDSTNKAYHCFLAKDQAEQIFPYEYWDTSLTYDEADQISEIFKSYCESMGIVPRFSGKDSAGKDTGFGDFAYGGENGRAVPGYWKLLIDRKMYSNKYDSEGNWVGYGDYRDQKRINVSNVKIESLDPAVANQSVSEKARTKDIHPEKTDRIVEKSISRIEAMRSQGAMYDLTKVNETFRQKIMPANSAIREAERSAARTGEKSNGTPEETRGLLSRNEAQGKVQGNISENDRRGVSDRYREETGKEQPASWEGLGVPRRDRLIRGITDLVAESGTREAEDLWINAKSDADFVKDVYEQTFLAAPDGGVDFEQAAERFVHYPSKLYRVFAQEFGLAERNTRPDERTVQGTRYTTAGENRDNTLTADPMEEASEGTTVSRFSLREEEPPEKTQWGFKLMRVDENGLPHAMFIDAARPYEYGTWYNADAPALDTLLQLEPGYAYLVDENNNVDQSTRKKITRTAKAITGLPGKGLINQATEEGKRWMTVTVDAKGKKAVANVGISGGKNPSPSTFAMRPGLHAVDIPSMAHIGPEYKDANGETKKKRRPDERWFLIEYPVDVDYNQEAYDNPGKDIRDHLPVNGWYSFQTNSGAEARQHWFITGGMKIVGAVTEEDVRRYAEDKGFEQDLEWLDGKSYDDNDGNAIDLYEYMKTAEAQPTPSKDEMRARIEAERTQQAEPKKLVIPPKSKTTPATQTTKTEAPAPVSRYSIQGQPATAQEAQSRYSVQDREANNWAPEFYSKMQNTIQVWTNGKGQPLPPKMSAQQVVGWLKGKGVKSEEIKWSGIVPFLEGKKTVTQQELLDVMAENEIKIETKVLESGTRYTSYLDYDTVPFNNEEEILEAAYRIFEESDRDTDDVRLYDTAYGIEVVDASTGEIVFTAEANNRGETHWSDYSSQGGENYREILFKMPGLDYTNQAMQVHWNADNAQDGQDVVAHARVQDMRTTRDEPALLVEEIQSDLHNAGTSKISPENARGITREHAAPGFADKLQREYQKLADIMEERDLTAEEERRFDWLASQLSPEKLTPAREAYMKAMAERRAVADELEALTDQTEEILKPFVDTGLLTVSHKDIEDWIAGADIDWEDSNFLDNFYDTFFDEDKARIDHIREVYKAARDASEDLVVANRNLTAAPPDVPFAGESDTYHEYVMKHMLRMAAEGDYSYLTWTTAQQQSDRWSDEFAEGYRIEYDQNIPKFMSKYGKQWGAKVTQIQLDNGETVWAVPVNEEMKRSVLETGQPLFSMQREEGTGNPYAPDTIEHDLLELARNGDAEHMANWINRQMADYDQARENAKMRAPRIPSKGFVPKVSAREKAALDKQLNAYLAKYGKQRPSEKSNGYVIPRKTDQGNLRRFLQNAGSAKQLERAQAQLERFTLTDMAATYQPDSNKQDLDAVKRQIADKGLDASIRSFQAKADATHVPTTQDIALGEQLLIETSANGDMRAFLDVLTSVCEMSTQIGKSLQAFRMLKKSGPIGQLYYVQKAVDRLNSKYDDSIRRGRMDKIVVSDELSQAVFNAPDEESRDAAMDQLIASIASQVPVTLKDKWDAWRYLSMLGNARTHIRNVLGNAIFVPLRYAKDLMAAGGELIATKAGWMDEQDRTKAITVSRELRDFAAADAEIMEKELRGNGKYNPAQEILNARRILPGFLETLSRKNGDFLETEDWIFLRGAYTRALSQALAHSGFTTEELYNTPEGQKALNNARRLAIEEAQKATYRDFSAVAAMLNRTKKLEGKSRITGILLEGVLPFTKTPINILKRGIEYSPLGIASGIGSIISGARDGNLNVAQVIDQLSAGLTGTGIAALGWLLARAGLLRGKRKDDDEENFEKLQGYQDYSLQFGDLSLTIDWAAPTALPLFTGAALAELMDSDEDLELKDAWDAMMMIAEPMTSLSMLDGLNSTLQSASYGTDNMWATVATSALTSYLGQAMPTLLGQLARSIDGTRRSTYVDKNSQMPAGMQRFIQTSIQNKTPGWEAQKTPYVDAWGREDTVSSKFLGALENFLSPSYINMVKTTDVDTALKELYDVTGADVLPKTPTKEIGKRDLSADEYVALAKDAGSTKYTLLTQLLSDPRYLALSDTEKAAAVKKIYDYANAAAKYHVDDTYDIHGQGVWIQEAEAMPTEIQRFNRIWEAIEAALKKQ